MLMPLPPLLPLAAIAMLICRAADADAMLFFFCRCHAARYAATATRDAYASLLYADACCCRLAPPPLLFRLFGAAITLLIIAAAMMLLTITRRRL